MLEPVNWLWLNCQGYIGDWHNLLLIYLLSVQFSDLVILISLADFPSADLGVESTIGDILLLLL